MRTGASAAAARPATRAAARGAAARLGAGLALLCLVCGAAALAEGAVQHLDCAVVTGCDGAGDCAPDEGTVALALEPTGLDPQGRQRLTLSYGEIAAEAVQDGPLGAIQWQEGPGDRQTLLPAGPSALLWHRLETAPRVASTTLFLTCESPR